MKIEKELTDRWEIGKVLPACHGTDFGDLELVGKENNSLQLARNLYGEDDEQLKVIEEYNPENIRLSESGGCVNSIKATRTITTINQDEYWDRVKVSEEKKKYIEILKHW